MVGLFVDVVWDVVGFVVGSVSTICEVECQVEVVNGFDVTLYDDIESIFFKDFLEIFFYPFCLRAADALERSKAIVSIWSNVFLVVSVGNDGQDVTAY